MESEEEEEMEMEGGGAREMDAITENSELMDWSEIELGMDMLSLPLPANADAQNQFNNQIIIGEIKLFEMSFEIGFLFLKINLNIVFFK